MLYIRVTHSKGCSINYEKFLCHNALQLDSTIKGIYKVNCIKKTTKSGIQILVIMHQRSVAIWVFLILSCMILNISSMTKCVTVIVLDPQAADLTIHPTLQGHHYFCSLAFSPVG